MVSKGLSIKTELTLSKKKRITRKIHKQGPLCNRMDQRYKSRKKEYGTLMDGVLSSTIDSLVEGATLHQKPVLNFPILQVNYIRKKKS